MRNILIAICIAVIPVAAASASAHDSELAALKAQLNAISQRIAELEQKHAETQPPAAPAAVVAPEPAKEVPAWINTIKLSGDLRYRHESIDQDGSEERTRHRVRARVGLKAKPAAGTEVGVRLASGGSDPVSTNQSLDGSFSTKGLQLDRAYIKQNVGADNVLTLGKMGNPFFLPAKSSLMWDSDLNPEGIAWNFGGDGFFANAAAFSVEERSSSSDTLMLGGQAGLTGKLDNGIRYTAGIGFYDYSAVKGRSPLFDDGGNTLDGSGN